MRHGPAFAGPPSYHKSPIPAQPPGRALVIRGHDQSIIIIIALYYTHPLPLVAARFSVICASVRDKLCHAQWPSAPIEATTLVTHDKSASLLLHLTQCCESANR
jgi:hypothetical protein